MFVTYVSVDLSFLSLPLYLYYYYIYYHSVCAWVSE